MCGKRIKVGKVFFLDEQNGKKVGRFFYTITGWLIERQMTKSLELIPTDFILITVQQFRITKVFININYIHEKGISFLFFSIFYLFFYRFIVILSRTITTSNFNI